MFSFVLILSSDLSVTTINQKENEEVNYTPNSNTDVEIIIAIEEENNTTATIDEDNEENTQQPINENKLTLVVNSNKIVYTDTETIIDTLTFENDVKISNVKSENNTYIALGSINNNPFMQEFQIDNQKIVSTTNPYIYHEKTGTLVDIDKGDYYIAATIKDSDGEYTKKFIQTNNQLIPFYKEHIKYNHFEDKTIVPEYLVIHETANTSIGADAFAHYRYWNSNPNANASTHFVVDNTQIYQMLDLDEGAWHVGDNHGHSDITNLNSIGIEVAVNADGNFTDARQNAIDLTISLMKSLNMDISQLKRHYDASGKNCPTTMLLNPELWDDFVNQVEVGLEK